MDKIPLGVKPVDRPSTARHARLESCLALLLAGAVLAVVCYGTSGRFLGWGAMSAYIVRQLVDSCGPTRGIRIFLENLDYSQTGVFHGETDGFELPVECRQGQCPARVSSARARRIGEQAVASWAGVTPRSDTTWADLGTAADHVERDYHFSASPEILALDPPPCLYKVSVFGQCVHSASADSAARAAIGPDNPGECCDTPYQYVYVLVDANTGGVLGLHCLVHSAGLPTQTPATPASAPGPLTRFGTAGAQPTVARPAQP